MEPYGVVAVVWVDKNLSEMDLPDNVVVQDVRARPVLEYFNVVVHGIGSEQVVVVVILFGDPPKAVEGVTRYPSFECVSEKVFDSGAAGDS